MTRWATHAICDDCWDTRNPGRRAFMTNFEPEPCCFCGGTATGIYVREDADKLPLCTMPKETSDAVPGV